MKDSRTFYNQRVRKTGLLVRHVRCPTSITIVRSLLAKPIWVSDWEFLRLTGTRHVTSSIQSRLDWLTGLKICVVELVFAELVVNLTCSKSHSTYRRRAGLVNSPRLEGGANLCFPPCWIAVNLLLRSVSAFSPHGYEVIGSVAQPSSVNVSKTLTLVSNSYRKALINMR